MKRFPDRPEVLPADSPSLDEVWPLLLAIASQRRAAALDEKVGAYRFDGGLRPVAADDPRAQLLVRQGGAFQAGPGLSAEQIAFVDLYLPILSVSADKPCVIGHLGQSLDGFIATASGDSYYVTGPENLTHMHRMRALCDAVIVGAASVAVDDPRLTTRLVDGPNPVRVVLDPDGRVSANSRIFNDGEAQTLWVRTDRASNVDALALHEKVSLVSVQSGSQGFQMPQVLEALQARGLHAVFVEGGGITISRWMAAGLLDRLQLTIAPVFIGEGRAGLQVSAMASMADCLRPPHAAYRLGADILWDFDLGNAAVVEPPASTTVAFQKLF